jgi:hypothetical protein
MDQYGIPGDGRIDRCLDGVVISRHMDGLRAPRNRQDEKTGASTHGDTHGRVLLFSEMV